MKLLRGWRWAGAAFLAVALAGGVGLLSETGTRAATTFHAFAGGGQSGISVETFRPKDIFIHAGDTIEWVNPYEEIHTVTFTGGEEVPPFIIPAEGTGDGGPPKLIINPVVANPTTETVYDGGYANSGVIGKGQTFSLTFPDLGNFGFICVVHPGMVGTVHVVDDGVTVPTQEQLNFEAEQSLANDLAAGEASSAATDPGKTENADGTTTWDIEVPASVGAVDVMRFIPTKLEISAGDTVTWNNDTFVPHTVTFVPEDEEAPGFAVPEFGDAGPPTIVLNPEVLFPVNADPDFSGTAYVNSGFFGAGPESTAPPQFSLTFDKPGSYLFICVLHIDQGMSSLIEVKAAGGGAGPVTPPSTGDGGLVDTSSPLLGLALVAGIGVLALAGMRRLAAAPVQRD